MRYLGAMELADTLTLMWQPPGQVDQLLELEFARTAIGVWLLPEPFLVVVGQRVYEDEKLYVVLDEHTDTDIHRFLQDLVAFKDRYRAYSIYIGDTEHVDLVRNQEGLTHYPEGSPAALRALFPSFSSADLIAQVTTQKIEEETAHHLIERMLSTQMWDPRTQMPMVGKDGQPVFQLHFPVEFDNQTTQAGIRGADEASCYALALALRGLDRQIILPVEEDYEHQGDVVTGY